MRLFMSAIILVKKSHTRLSQKEHLQQATIKFHAEAEY